MGFKKEWDTNSIRHQLWIMAHECGSRYNDGFTQWAIKQDLYRIKWLLDEIMADSPKFSDEEEFLKEHEQVKMWRTLTR